MTDELPAGELSWGQQRMWMLSEVSHGAAALNLVMAVRLSGVLDAAALRQALDDVARRHDVLTSVFQMERGVVRQRPGEHRTIPVELIDVAGFPPGLLDPMLAGQTRRGFDLDSGPVARARLISLGTAEHVLTIALHHIVGDGWSFGILADEIGQLYQRYREGVPGRLPGPPAAAYQDFVTWQRQHVIGHTHQIIHRVKHLEGMTGGGLPLDSPLPVPGTHRAAITSVVLPPSLTQQLHELRRREGGTVFMLILTAVVIVIGRLGRRRDVTVGTFAAGRSNARFDHTIGYFVNLLLLRADADPALPFRELWERVRDECVAAFAAQDTPYEKLLEAMVPDRASRLAPPVSVLCVMQQPAPELNLPGLVATAMDVPHAIARFDLTLEIREHAGTLTLAFQFDTDVLDQDTVQTIGRAMQAVLTEAVTDPSCSVNRLPLALQTRRSRRAAAAQAVSPSSRTGDRPDDGSTLHSTFDARATRTPDAVAITHGSHVITYRGLEQAARRLAAHLGAAGIGPDDIVGVCLPRSAASVVAALATLTSGACFLPLDPELPEQRLAALVAAARPAAVIAFSAAADRVSRLLVPMVTVDEQGRPVAAGPGPAARPREPDSPDQLAYVLHTSGSSGQPKPVMGTHRAVLNRLRWMAGAHPYRRGERAALRAPLGFVDAVTELFGPLLAGTGVDIVDDADVADPARLRSFLTDHHITRLVVVPSLLRMLLHSPASPSSGLLMGTWVSSGEVLAPDLARRFHQILPGSVLLNLYGSTEVAGDATGAVIEPDARSVTIGAPIAGVTAAVLRPDGRPAAVLEPGELHIGGAALARGYHRLPSATAAAFEPDPDAVPPGGRRFRTHDTVRTDVTGSLRFLGRSDDQLQVRGIRVEPGEIESVLGRHPRVAQAAVTAWPDAAGSTALAGYVVLTPSDPGAETGFDLETLRRFLRGQLPPYLVPSFLGVLDALPRNDNGKVDRARLPAPQTLAAPPHERRADTPTSEIVSAVFRRLLPIQPSGPDDDFFALGGHSILAVAAVHALQEACGPELTLQDLFEARTIGGIATLIDARGGPGLAASPASPGTSADQATTVPAEGAPFTDDSPFPLTDVQQAYWIGRDSGFPLGSVATHAYFEVDATDLDADRLDRAINQLVSRHPALRTVVQVDGLQRVLANVPDYRMDVTDLRDASARPVVSHLEAVRQNMSHQVLPAGRWPLFDLRLTHLPDGVRLHVSIDALIADAYSVRILMAELGILYADPDTELPAVGSSFRAHVLKELDVRRTAGYTRAAAYWRNRLPDLPRGPQLPLRVEAGSIGQPRFQRWTHGLRRDAWDRLQERAAEAGLTPSIVLLSAYAEVLSRWSAHPHFTLNLTLFSRDHADPASRRVVGDFTSLTLLEVDHRAAGGFLDRARRLQQRLWTDLDHRAFGGVEVLREWTRVQSGAPALLTPVVFTSNLGLDTGDGPAAPPLGTMGYALTQTPQLYLDHQVAEGPEGLALSWDAVPELFPAGLMDDLTAAHGQLLDRLAGPDSDWNLPAALDLPAHQSRRRSMVNATARPVARVRLETMVAGAAQRNPDAIAVQTEHRQISYRALVAAAGRIARHLQEAGVAGGELVAVACRKGPEQIAAVLGVLAAGGAYLPLDPDLPQARLNLLCRTTGVRHALVHGQAPPLPSEVALLPVPDLPDPPDAPDPPNGPDAPDGPMPDDLAWPELAEDDTATAYVIFTSGSTGVPKGVVIDHAGAVGTVLDINRRHRVSAGDAVLGVSALSFDLSVYDIFGTLGAGATLVLPDPARLRDPGHWAGLMRRHHVTIWNSVPALMGLLADHPAFVRGSLRLVLLSGDWIPLSLPGRVRKIAPDAEIIGMGGATEASIWSVRHRIGRIDPADPADPEWTSIPYGRPLTNQRVHVLDADLEPRPDWVPGELYISGTGLARGYWGDPELTSTRFPTHPRSQERLYRTGDQARYRPGGTLEFLGREDQQVKISGYRVELGEVESALASLPGVAAGAVIAEGPARGEKRLVGFLQPADGVALDPHLTRERLREILPAPLVPSRFITLDQLPLTGNGKLDRGRLVTLAGSGHPPATVSARTPDADPGPPPAVSDAVTRWLTTIWERVLDVGDIGFDDNFFELGGTSLVAVRLVSRIEAEQNIQIPLIRLYESPTISQLGAEIQAQLDLPDRQSISPPAATGLEEVSTDRDHRHEPFPLTGVQEAYWLGRHPALRLGGVATHSYQELDVEDLSLTRLATAVQALIARHDALRTVVRADGTQQVLRDVPDYQISCADLTGMSPADADAELMAIRSRESHRIHAPGTWPLFSVTASRLDQERTRLHIGLDLLVADAQSFLILQKELSLLYAGEDLPAPPAITFRDYQVVIADRRARSGSSYRRAERYWIERLAELPPAPALPLLRDPASIITPQFTRIQGELNRSTWRHLQAAAAQRNLTPSGLLGAAFGDVLATWSGQRRFLLNLTTFNRQPVHPDIDRIVGDFTSTTLLAVDVAGASFAARASQLQRQIFTDLEHREFSGVDVLRLLRADPALRAKASAPVVFTSLLVPEPKVSAVEPQPWRAEPVYSVSQTSQVLLDHQVIDHDGVLRYSWDHVIGAFPPGLVEAMHQSYRDLLASLADGDQAWSDDERR